MIFRIFKAGIFYFLFSGVLVIASETNQKQIETKRSGFWTYYCKNSEKERKCEIARKINIIEQNETFLIIYRITKDASSNFRENLNILVPPRANTKKNLKLSFDEKTKFSKS